MKAKPSASFSNFGRGQLGEQKSILLRKRVKLRRPKAFRLSTLILLLKPSVNALECGQVALLDSRVFSVTEAVRRALRRFLRSLSLVISGIQ